MRGLDGRFSLFIQCPEVFASALSGRVLVLVGANDEAIDAQALRAVFVADAPQAQVTIMPEISHFGIFTEPAAWNAISSWLQKLPPSPGVK